MKRPATFLALSVALAASAAHADGPSGPGGPSGTILGTRHNLSVSGPGPIKAQSETEVCIFCHVPHQGRGLGSNRPDRPASYRPYRSSTMASPPVDRPGGASRVCLSCHDGTIALGETLASGVIEMTGAGPGGRLADRPSSLGTDLGRNHPVSILPAVSPRLRAPDPNDSVRLDARGQVQCTSCHDPHRDDGDPVQRMFLVKSNRNSALCLSCHVAGAWLTNPSSHQSSTALYDRSRGATTPWTSVAENGCESCHRPHGAADGGRLLKADGAALCLACHDGRVARFDLASQSDRPFGHTRSRERPDVHDAAEGPRSAERPLPEDRLSVARHATCVDCHNVHASFRLPNTAPQASGALSGVWGIDRNGAYVAQVQFEYEVCFKCHGDSANAPQARGPQPPETLRRAVVDANLRRVFDLASPSFHPVEGAGRNPDVPSLVSPLTTASVIYCTDCHASDDGPGAGGRGPRGPHGSTYRHLLERNLSTADRTPESPAAYALCYKCHDRGVLLSDRSAFRLHALHVQKDSTPCTACHAAHGVSSIQGNPVNNAHLIDFDVSVVSAGRTGVREFRDTGSRHGRCTLSCHGREHAGLDY